VVFLAAVFVVVFFAAVFLGASFSSAALSVALSAISEWVLYSVSGKTFIAATEAILVYFSCFSVFLSIKKRANIGVMD
jgi:ABC-type uncharacterized transport system permease subunit